MADKLEKKLNYCFENRIINQTDNKVTKYEIIIEYDLGKWNRKEYITIDSVSMVRDILNEIYYLIADVVKPYTYLKSWVLLEVKSHRAAIISDDIYDWIPAQSVFKVNTLWKVVYLNKPLLME